MFYLLFITGEVGNVVLDLNSAFTVSVGISY